MCIGTATYSLLNIVLWTKDNINTNKNNNDLKEKININEYITEDNFKMLDINFDELEKTNSDIVAYLKVDNTLVDYPIVKTNNNSFYLNHSIDKTHNNAGWTFLDYRNDINNLDHNNIIYGHSRKDKTMFGSLFNLLNKSWFKNNSHYIYLSTKKENLLWEIFSIYIINNEEYFLVTNFNNSKEHIEYINDSIKRSIYNFNITLDQNDKILTLSTCNGRHKKLVIQAKLIKKEIKLHE